MEGKDGDRGWRAWEDPGCDEVFEVESPAAPPTLTLKPKPVGLCPTQAPRPVLSKTLDAVKMPPEPPKAAAPAVKATHPEPANPAAAPEQVKVSALPKPVPAEPADKAHLQAPAAAQPQEAVPAQPGALPPLQASEQDEIRPEARYRRAGRSRHRRRRARHTHEHSPKRRRRDRYVSSYSS